MDPMATSPAQHRKPPKPWQTRTVGALVTVAATGLAAYAAAASYESVSRLAALYHVPLHQLTPVGLDGGLIGVIGFDIGLTWIGRPQGGLRLASRLFAAATIAANAAAGWPRPVGVGLRVFAPLLLVIIVEAARTVLLGRDRQDARIPLARWLLAPRQTFTIWRRAKLWNERLPESAAQAELAIVKLAERFGAGWQDKAPAELAWRIRTGVGMDRAVEMVASLTAPRPLAEAVSAPVNGRRQAPASRGASRTRQRKPATAAKAAAVATDFDVYAEALKILADEPGVSASELGRRLGRSASRGRQIKAQLAAAAPADPQARSEP